MEKEPLHVTQSLLTHVITNNSGEIATIFRLYLTNSQHVNEEVCSILSTHFIQLLNLNHQTRNRILEDLLLCLPYLGMTLERIV